MIIHLDFPADRTIRAIPQFLAGWLATDEPLDETSVQMDSTEVVVEWTERPDVQAAHPGKSVRGWQFWQNPMLLEREAPFCHLRFLSEGTEMGQLRFAFAPSLLPASVTFPKLFWMHIPKTAGTTVWAAVGNQMASDASLRVYEDRSGISLPHVLEVPAAYLSSAQLVFGHFAFGAHRLLDCDPAYATVLRDPIDLMRSYLAFGFTSGEGDRFLDNGLTRFLSGTGYKIPKGEVGKEHLEEAKENIERYFLHIGYTQDLQDSIDWLADYFTVSRRDATRENVTATSKSRRLPDYADVSFDLELYNWCRLTDPVGQRHSSTPGTGLLTAPHLLREPGEPASGKVGQLH